MPNALADAISPYLRSHADNPVAWQQWSAAAFAEARRRDVPVLISIGYSTCHWCHVMARETFSDPEVAARVNDAFVAIKVDREEHPDVDSSYLAAAAAFTENLGWPLTVFATPDGRAFYAGTYYPPVPVQGHPSFTQVVDAVLDAWTSRRDEVEENAGAIAAALLNASAPAHADLPTRDDLYRTAGLLGRFEDTEYGGFGGAPKFPVAPVQLLLLQLGAGAAGEAPTDDAAAARVAGALAARTLGAMAASPLRDDVDGGFFRYSTRRDWSDPHYERMLYDNAQLLTAYSRLSTSFPPTASGPAAQEPSAAATTAGIADFLLATLQTEEGGFGSAQDSESTVAGTRTEGGYYALDAAGRASETPPAVDDKVLTGWNGLAIGALAEAGTRHARADWTAAAVRAADRLLSHHVTADGGLLRASTARGVSTAVATLEDFGMLALGFLRLATATGRVEYATHARRLVDDCLLNATDARVFAAPGGGDPVLAGQGLTLQSDPSEGAYPSGLSSMATAAFTLFQLTADGRYRDAAARAVASVSVRALESPIAFGTILTLALDLSAPATQLVVVRTDSPGVGDGALVAEAHSRFGPGLLAVAVTAEQARAWAGGGFELFEGREPRSDADVAYLCRDFVCRLPVTSIADLY